MYNIFLKPFLSKPTFFTTAFPRGLVISTDSQKFFEHIFLPSLPPPTNLKNFYDKTLKILGKFLHIKYVKNRENHPKINNKKAKFRLFSFLYFFNSIKN